VESVVGGGGKIFVVAMVEVNYLLRDSGENQNSLFVPNNLISSLA